MISTPEQPRDDDWRGPLRARFPMARSIGIGCFKGWQPILTRMFERLEATIAQQPAAARRGFKIREIRQKFGTLTVYLTKATPEVQAVVDEAQAAALVTCEVCGAPGRLAERRLGWISVKCDAHENWTRFDDVGT